MRATIVVVLTWALALLVGPGLAAAQEEGCTQHARVTWDTGTDSVRVDAAHVAVPGCADGERVGLQLLTDDGDLPLEPLIAAVVDEHAVFDLVPLDVRIEPVTGVRIVLYGADDVVLVEVEVEQRYFSAPGREQRGLRRTDLLQVPLGGRYVVPEPGPGYATVACAEVGVSTEGTLAEGAGTFDAGAGGRHLACHRRTSAGPAPARPGSDGPQVLGESEARIERRASAGGTEVLGASADRRAGAGLPRTGVDPLVVLGTGLGLLVVGASTLANQRRRRGSPGHHR